MYYFISVGWPPDWLLVVFDNLLLQQKTMSYILVLLLILFLCWILISDFQMTCCSCSLQIFISVVSLLIYTLYESPSYKYPLLISEILGKYRLYLIDISCTLTYGFFPLWPISSYQASINCIWLDHSTPWYWWHTDIHVLTPFLLSEPIHVLVYVFT